MTGPTDADESEDATLYEQGDELAAERPDLQGGTYTERAAVMSVTGDGGPRSVVALDHPGDNLYTVGEDGQLLGRFDRETAWERVEEVSA